MKFSDRLVVGLFVLLLGNFIVGWIRDGIDYTVTISALTTLIAAVTGASLLKDKDNGNDSKRDDREDAS